MYLLAGEKILVVDDEAVIREWISHSLRQEGFAVVTADTGGEALAAVDREKPDLILLDILLPDLDGLEICREVRRKTDVPVIFVTSKSDSLDVVLGLGLGGDDYITKPFKSVEVVARVKAQLRRRRQPAPPAPSPKRLEFPGLSIDLLLRSVEVNGSPRVLSTKEFDILALLAANPDRFFSTDELLEEVWQTSQSADPRTLVVHISRLRKKIEDDPANPRYLISVRNVGYRFNGCP